MPLQRRPDRVYRTRLTLANGYNESFNGRFPDEFLATKQFNTLLEAQVLAEDWRIEYNTIRPHGSLGGLTPTQFHQQWINQPALS
jgi:putative transposase